MSTPHDAGMPGRPVPPSAQGSGGRPWLIAAVIVLSLALIAMLWFGIRPMLSGGGAPQSSGVGANPSDSGQPSSPDTFGPLSWSAPLTIADANDFSASPVAAPVVRESGIDGIDLAGWALDGGSYHLQAVDSSTLRALWGPTQFCIKAATQDGLVVNPGSDCGGLAVLDPRTGNTISPARSGFIYGDSTVGSGMIVTTYGSDLANLSVCGQKISAPGQCVWTKSGPGLRVGRVFGGGAWVDLGIEVVDVATGEPASFGKRMIDPYSSDTFEGPTKDRAIHSFDGPQPWITNYQLWNTQTDAGIGQLLAFEPEMAPTLIYDTELPVFMVVVSDGTLTTYSWQTGEQQWQTKLASDVRLGQIYGDTVLLSDYDVTSAAGVWGVDATTGKITGHYTAQGMLSGVIAGVAYLIDGTTLTAVDATTLARLGTLAYPEPGAWVGVVGGHVAAMTQSGQYYVLRT